MINLNGVSKVTRISLFVNLFLLFIFLPLVNQNDFVNSTVTSKTILFIHALLIILGLCVFQIIFNKINLIAFKISKLDISLSILFVFVIFNRYVLQSNYGFSIRFIELLGLGVLYIILRSLKIKIFIWILLAIVVSGIIQAVYGNLQLFGYYQSNHSVFKITGSFFNPGPYSGFLVAVWSIALGLYLFKESILKQALLIENKWSLILNSILKYIFEYVPIIGVITIILVVPATQSRASWLSIIISSILLLELKYHILKNVLTKINTLKKAILIICSVFILGITLFGVYHFKKGSSDGRLFIWKVSSEIIKDNPVFGVGFDRFKAHYMNAQANYFAKNGETAESMIADNSYYAFNEFVQLVVENGLIGIMFLIVLLIFIVRAKAKKEHQDVLIILKACVLAIAVFACFSYPMQILPIKIILLTTLAMLATVDAKVYKIELPQNNAVHRVFKTSLLVIAIFGITKAGLYANAFNEGFKTWQFALTPYLDYETTLEEYETAYPLFKKDGDFLMNYGKTLCLAKKYPKAILVLQQAKQYLNTTIIETALGDAYKAEKQYGKAELAYKYAYNMIPSRFYPLYLLAKLYDEQGDNAKAVLMANSLINKEVKISSTAIEEMKVEMKAIIAKQNIDSMELNKSQYR